MSLSGYLGIELAYDFTGGDIYVLHSDTAQYRVSTRGRRDNGNDSLVTTRFQRCLYVRLSTRLDSDLQANQCARWVAGNALRT